LNWIIEKELIRELKKVGKKERQLILMILLSIEIGFNLYVRGN
jgi:hypothetical protein